VKPWMREDYYEWGKKKSIHQNCSVALCQKKNKTEFILETILKYIPPLLICGYVEGENVVID
jgi:hypothetical protein